MYVRLCSCPTGLDFNGASAGNSDLVAIKLDDAGEGAELWRWQVWMNAYARGLPFLEPAQEKV